MAPARIQQGNHLTCRSQLMVVDGEKSCVLPMIFGVPQGSVLDPLVFLVFINEVTNQGSLDSFISLFADDNMSSPCMRMCLKNWSLDHSQLYS